MTDESFKKIKPYSTDDWHKEHFGWSTVSNKEGADFRVSIGDNIEINGEKVFKKSIQEWVKEELSNGMHNATIARIQDLIEEIKGIQVSLNYNSNSNSIKVNHIEGVPPYDYSGLVKEIYMKTGYDRLFNITFYNAEDNIPEVAVRKFEGRCPQCGERGKFLRTALMCKIHGVYGGF